MYYFFQHLLSILKELVFQTKRLAYLHHIKDGYRIKTMTYLFQQFLGQSNECAFHFFCSTRISFWYALFCHALFCHALFATLFFATLFFGTLFFGTLFFGTLFFGTLFFGTHKTTALVGILYARLANALRANFAHELRLTERARCAKAIRHARPTDTLRVA
jgi:hypothetical protein